MSLREWIARLFGAFGLGRRDEDLAGELAFHREMLEARNRERGMDPDAARRAAAVELGGAAQIAETYRDQRGLPFADALAQDTRYGLRVLRRSPGFTVAALLTLAVGIGANAAIFTVVDAVLIRPLPYADPDRLVTVGDRSPAGFSSNVGYTTVVEWRERSRSFDAFAMMRSWLPTLTANGEAERVAAVRVSANYFDLLGVRPALGRGFTQDDDRPEHWRVLILSDALWRRRFSADPSVVGRTVVMNDTQYRVVGVMPAAFEPLDAERYYGVRAELWAPIGYDLKDSNACRSCQHLRGFARLKRGVTIGEATAEMNALREQMRREHPADYDAGSIAVVPLRDALTGDVRTALLILLGAVGFVLLIACANVANLLLSRSVTRQRELALRAALGAGRARIARQLLTESLLLSAGGALAGIVLAFLATSALGAMAPVSLLRIDHAAVDSRALLFTVAIALMSGVVFGVVPAWRGGVASVRALAIDSRGSVGGVPGVRAALVVADLALALVLLAGAGLMLRTVAAMMRANPGFDAAGVLALDFSLVGKAYAEDSAVVAFQQQVIERLRALPGVEAVAVAGQVPFGGNFDCRGFHVKGRMKPNSSEDPCIERYGVTPGFTELLKIPVLSGRPITAADVEGSQPVVVVSESTARTVFGNDSPIGAQVRIGNASRGAWRTIVGVVADVRHEDLTAPPIAAIYTPQAQFADSYLVALVKVTGADPLGVAAPARQAIRDLDPSVPVYRIATLPALVAGTAAQRLFVMRLLAGFAVVAVLLAAIGLYGVVSYGVAMRTREVGVRVALGAQRADVLRLVLMGGLKLVAVGVAAGVAGAAAATRLLGTLVFGVSPMDPLTFTTAAALLTVAALAAHWVPVRRALRIDPASALRSD